MRFLTPYRSPYLTHEVPVLSSYRNQSIDLLCKSVDWCLYIYIFSISVFFGGYWRLTGQQGKGRDHLLFHSTTFTRSRTFRHLIATLHVRWLSHIFNCIACIYQTATRWDLPPHRITIWLIDDWTSSFCLRDDLILASLLQQFETGNRWIRTRIDHHPCITSETTNQVCCQTKISIWGQHWHLMG